MKTANMTPKPATVTIPPRWASSDPAPPVLIPVLIAVLIAELIAELIAVPIADSIDELIIPMELAMELLLPLVDVIIVPSAADVGVAMVPFAASVIEAASVFGVLDLEEDIWKLLITIPTTEIKGGGKGENVQNLMLTARTRRQRRGT
jgi:hypothetical protein